jgi:hypothetical protein
VISDDGQPRCVTGLFLLVGFFVLTERLVVSRLFIGELIQMLGHIQPLYQISDEKSQIYFKKATLGGEQVSDSCEIPRGCGNRATFSFSKPKYRYSFYFLNIQAKILIFEPLFIFLSNLESF